MIRLAACFIVCINLKADTGDPQLVTNHPWYPGELAISSFENLAKTQAKQYEAATKTKPITDQDVALASWQFRNTHYAHGEEGREDLFGKGFANDNLNATREYWTGLFAHGIGLCGTTHAQWTAELDELLGPCRSRVTGTAGHNSFEVFLTGKGYQSGRWALLDHDLSTVLFDDAGDSLLGLDVISKDWQRLTNRDVRRNLQHGWLPCGLHPDDGRAYAEYQSAEYKAGYAGPPPIVHLRSGESLRRYFAPGLDDGQTFVFWGRNYMTGNIPGPERSRTWVNQPERMYQSQSGTSHNDGQFRYGNAVYTWRLDFSSDKYREGVHRETEQSVALEFYTPYIIAATPANDSAWGIYEAGCRNGLVLHGSADCKVSVSVDGGATWSRKVAFVDGLDLTDHVKGHRQYLIQFDRPAKELAKSNITIETVCQANPATMPRLKDNGTEVRYAASGQAIVSFGPNKQQAASRIIDGAFDTSSVTLRLSTPRGEKVTTMYAAAHIASGNPPDSSIEYFCRYSTDGGKNWQVADGVPNIQRRGVEPTDFWSQSMRSWAVPLRNEDASEVLVRFDNTGKKSILRAEGHLVYQTNAAPVQVTYSWTDNQGDHQATQTMNSGDHWQIETNQNVQTRWVELKTDR
jgi:hypothetical protein